MEGLLRLLAVESTASVVAVIFAAGALVYGIAALRAVAAPWRPCVTATVGLLALELVSEVTPLFTAHMQSFWRVPEVHYGLWLVIFPIQAAILVMLARRVSGVHRATPEPGAALRFALPLAGLVGAVALFPSAESGILAALAGLAAGYELALGAPARAARSSLDDTSPAAYGLLCLLLASGCVVYPLGLVTSHLGGAGNDPVLAVAFTVSGVASRTAFALLVLREAARHSRQASRRHAFFTDEPLRPLSAALTT